jgi:hypothetical protein
MYNRNNINVLSNTEHNTIVICAPTGNRLQVAQEPEKDLNNCQQIVQYLQHTTFKHIVHISTVDTFLDTPYGHNRRWLENQIKNHSSTIVRLPSLVHSQIQKNVLFDLANELWLDKISLDSTIQWYPMQRLAKDIEWAVTNHVDELNLVSRPISNRELALTLAPTLLNVLEQNKITPMHYNLSSIDKTYWILDKEIWNCIIKCFLELKQKSWKLS